jgi:predicted MPP superfamily phosphohydrolase
MNKTKTLILESPGVMRLMAALVWVALHLYAGRPIVSVATAHGLFPAIVWGALVLMSALSLLPFLTARTTGLSLRGMAHWSGYTSMAFFAVLFALVALGDLFRSAVALTGWLALTVGSSHTFAVDGAILNLVTLGAGASLALVGGVQARRPRIRRVKVPVAGLPDELDGYRVVQLSDVHIGPTIQRGFVRSLVKRVNRLAPDAVAITGDLVDAYVSEVGSEVAPLADLKSRDGVFYVTGNHEYYWRFSEWSGRLKEVGLDFLKNEHRLVRRGGATISFIGVTDPVGRHTHKQDLDKALHGVPTDSVKVLLSHRPQTAAAASKRGVDVQLSGHTHGGQFFPFNLVIKYFQPVVAGLHRVGKLQLYVSRGTGYWGPPSRLGVGGEITLITLVKG